jgi:hypothetical protein
MSVSVRGMVKVNGNSKQKKKRTKYRPGGIVLNVYAMICFKIKLQLIFRKNKN